MASRSASRATPVAVFVVLAILLLGKFPSCATFAGKLNQIGAGPATTTTTTPPVKGIEATSDARIKIARLATAEPGTMKTYERAAFGPPWADVDRNGCDTRNDILQRDLTNVTYRAKTHNCVVITGTLNDPYTGKTIHFTKAAASKVQIDHVYPLGAAWRMGASNWTPSQRERFANDPTNLLAVDGRANNLKSDKLPSEWLPPNHAEDCTYALKLALVAYTYNLPVTPEDKAAMSKACA